jgi:uncharacterized surface protein with fasciclin (FAS1) repeats
MAKARRTLHSFLLLTLLLLALPLAVLAQETPSVTASDQDSDGASVTVDSVTAAVPGWMVIHADNNGAPGPVLGQTFVEAGTTEGVVVELDPPLEGSVTLWAMLHIDEGVAGTYEFPGADAPVREGDMIVMQPFAANVAMMTEESDEGSDEAMAADAMAADIVDTAVAAGSFNTLVAAVQAAGLVDALKGDGPFTVFAPTDDAFAALPAGTVDALLADPTGDLTQILLYHVVPGQVMAADVTDGLEAATLQGGLLSFSVADGYVKVNDANVTATDIVASNGVIHVIDAVLMPPTDEAMDDGDDMAAEDEESMDEAAPEVMPVTGVGAGALLINSLTALLASLGALGTGAWLWRRRK